MATKRSRRAERQPFTTTSLGTYIDGAFGQAHTVQTMEGILTSLHRRSVDAREAADELLDELENLDPEDVEEWLDDATDLLNEYTEPGLVFELGCGRPSSP